MKNKIKKNIKLLIGGIIATAAIFGVIAIVQLIVNTICNIILR